MRIAYPKKKKITMNLEIENKFFVGFRKRTKKTETRNKNRIYCYK